MEYKELQITCHPRAHTSLLRALFSNYGITSSETKK